MATLEPDAAPPRDSVFTVMLRKSIPPSAIAGGLTALILGILHGPGSGISGLLGVAIAVAFFASALLGMARFARNADPLLFVAVGMSVYFAQVLGLLGVLVLARRIDAFETRPAGIAMLVVVLVWQVAQVRAWRRARIPVYDMTHTEDVR